MQCTEVKCPAAAPQQQPSSLCCSWGEMMGPGQSRRWMAPPQTLFLSHTLLLLLAHLFLQALIPCDVSNTKQTSGSSAAPTSNKTIGPCVRHLSNKKSSPPFLTFPIDTSAASVASGVPSARAVQLQAQGCWCRMSRRTHPALQPAHSTGQSHVTHSSRQLAKPHLGGSQDLEHCDEELQGSQHDLNKHKGLNSGFFSSLAFWLQISPHPASQGVPRGQWCSEYKPLWVGKVLLVESLSTAQEMCCTSKTAHDTWCLICMKNELRHCKVTPCQWISCMHWYCRSVGRLITQSCKSLRIVMINLSLWCGGTKGLQPLTRLAGSQILDKHKPKRPFLSQSIYNLRCSTRIVWCSSGESKGKV